MAIKRLCIAMIEPVGGHGGMDYYDFGLCEGLKRAGAEITLYTCEKTRHPEDAGFSVVHAYRGVYGADPTWKRALRYVRGTITALRHSLRSKSAIVHFHLFQVGPLECMNLVLARLLRRKTVVTVHDVESFHEKLPHPLLTRLAYRLAHALIVHNQSSRKALQEKMGVPHEKVTIIPHGSYLHAISPLPDRVLASQRLGLTQGKKTLLFFGQIKDVKGLDLLLRALPLIVEQHPDAMLIVAGKPWDTNFAKYEKLIEETGCRKNCLLHIGYIRNEDVPDYYAVADLVVLPYRHIYQSGVLLMAMSYGCPVLVSDISGMTEIVKDGETGFVFASEDVENLARNVIKILSEPEQAKTCAQRGRRLMESDFSWSVIGEKTLSVYEKTL